MHFPAAVCEWFLKPDSSAHSHVQPQDDFVGPLYDSVYQIAEGRTGVSSARFNIKASFTAKKKKRKEKEMIFHITVVLTGINISLLTVNLQMIQEEIKRQHANKDTKGI